MFEIELIIHIKMDLALNNLQKLICLKTQPINHQIIIEDMEKRSKIRSYLWVGLDMHYICGVPLTMKGERNGYLKKMCSCYKTLAPIGLATYASVTFA